MKIICVNQNYPLYNKEQNIPFLIEKPVIYTKPDSALLKDGKPFFLPDFSEDIRCSSALVLRVCRLGKNIARRFASRYYDAVTVGVDFQAVDLIREAKDKGQDYALYNGFDGSAVLGDFVDMDRFGDRVNDIVFDLHVNESKVQSGQVRDMIFSFDEIIEYVSRFYTMKIGDLIYTGFPSSAFSVSIDDRLQGYVGEEKVLDFYIR